MAKVSTTTDHVRRWFGDAREGRFRLAGLTVTTNRRTRRMERNAFELGRDHERQQQTPLA